MRTTKRASKKLFLESLEDRLCLSSADPAIVFTFDQTVNRTVVSNLAVMNAEGSNQTTILSVTGRHFRTPAWSPDLDGNPLDGYQGTLAVSTYTGSLNSDDQIWVVDVSVVNGIPQASNVRTLVDKNDPGIPAASYGIARDAVWSPDLDPITPGYQGQIAFMTGTSINVIDVAWNGTTVNPVNGPDTSRVLFSVANPSTASVGWPTWSNDGTKVAFDLQLAPCGNFFSCGTTSLVTINRDGTNLTTVIPGGYSLFPNWITDLDWSKTPGSTRVAFIGSQNQVGGVPNNLYTVDVNIGVSSIQQISAASYSTRSPSWSADDSATTTVDETDKFIIFAGQDLVKKNQVTTSTIRRVELATGTQTILASNANAALLWPDLRPFPSAGWAPTSNVTSTSTTSQATSINNSSSAGHSTAPAPASSGAILFEFSIPTPSVLGLGTVDHANPAGSGKGIRAAPSNLTPIAMSLQSDFTDSVAAAPIRSPMPTAPHTLEDLTGFWADFSDNLLVQARSKEAAFWQPPHRPKTGHLAAWPD